MISVSNGEVNFEEDGLRISAHARLSELLDWAPLNESPVQKVSIPGWQQYALGIHGGEFGRFLVEVTTNAERRVEAVYLCHRETAFVAGRPIDCARAAFHESIIVEDLMGQREFPWGYVFCHLNMLDLRNWLIVTYSPFSEVPLQERALDRVLMAHEAYPEIDDDDHPEFRRPVRPWEDIPPVAR